MYRYWSCGHGGNFAVIVATQNLELAYAGCRQTKNLKIHATSTTKTTRESTAYASGHTQIQIYLNNARCCSAAFVRTGFMSTILAFHPPCRFCSVVFVVKKCSLKSSCFVMLESMSTINSQLWLNPPELWKSWTIWLTCREWWLQLAYPTAWDLWWHLGMVMSLLCDCAAVSKRWRRGAFVWWTGVPGLCTSLLFHLSVSKGFDSSQFSNWWCSRRSCWSCGASYFQRLVTEPAELVTKTQIEGSCDTPLLIRISCYVKLPLAYN